MKNSTLLANKEKDVSISDREVEDNCCTIFQSRIICLHFRPKWSFYFRNFTVCAPSSLSLDSDRCRMLVHFVNEIESMFCVTLLPKWIQEFRSVLHWIIAGFISPRASSELSPARWSVSAREPARSRSQIIGDSGARAGAGEWTLEWVRGAV